MVVFPQCPTLTVRGKVSIVRSLHALHHKVYRLPRYGPGSANEYGWAVELASQLQALIANSSTAGRGGVKTPPFDGENRAVV
jgi:hypothetical protein